MLHYLIKEKFGHFFMGKEPTQAAQGNMYPTIQALITENRATYNLLRAMIIPSWEGKLASQVQHLDPSSTKDTAANRFVIRERLCFKNNPIKKNPKNARYVHFLHTHAHAHARGLCSAEDGVQAWHPDTAHLERLRTLTPRRISHYTLLQLVALKRVLRAAI